MKTYTAVIVDDEPAAREILSGLIADYFPDVKVVANAGSADEAIGIILAEDPDIVFLDIDMPGKNGFEVARTIGEQNFQTTIIFVTAFNQFAIDAIRCAAFDYLLKPVSVNDLKASFNRLKGRRKTESLHESMDRLLSCLNREKLSFICTSGRIFIDTLNILYCEADGNYTDLYLMDGNRQTVSQNLTSVENQLIGKGFSRISRSVLINRRHLHKINKKEKKCILQVDGKSHSLDIKGSYLRKWDL